MNDMDILERLEYFEPDDLVECAMYRECIEGVKTLILENKELKERNKQLIEINNKYNDMKHIARIAMLYIPKSKVEEKIEEIGDIASIGNDLDYMYAKGQYELCKELLGKE